MARKILLALAVLVVAFIAVVVAQPDTVNVSRTVAIATPPEVPFAIVSDFHRWSAFSPWDKLDPDQKRTYSGPTSGIGSSYAWEGNDDVGAGKMTITESKPFERLDIRLEFIRPFASENAVSFLLVPSGSETQVTWQMSGRANFLSKAFGLFVDMDEMLGKDFLEGLTALKAAAEADFTKQRAEKVAAEKLARPEAEAADAAAAVPNP